jgi:hypothetical protein
MKTTKFTRLAAVVLALAFVFSAMVGVNICAATSADEGSATITNKNVDHGTELALCFAVSEGTVDGTIYLLVWDDDFTGEYTFATAEQKKTALGDVTIGGETRKLFIADSIAAKDIDAPITFRTCIETADGEYVYGEVESYSVLDYVAQRLSEIPTDEKLDTDAKKNEQINVCNAIIRYNEAAEAVLGKGKEPKN